MARLQERFNRTTAPPCLFSIMDRLRVDPAEISLEKWKRHVLETVSDHFDADKANFVSQDSQGPPVQLTKNTRNWNNKAFLDHYYALDPLGFMIKTHSGLKLTAGPQSHNRVVRLEDVVDQTTLMNSEYYNDFLMPQQISHEAIIYFKSGKHILGILSIMRRSSEGFTSEEIAILKILEPFLTSCFENTLLHNESRRHRKILNSLEDQTNSGIVLLNSKTEVIYSNQQAQDLFKDMQTPLSAVAHSIEENRNKLNEQMNSWHTNDVIPPVHWHLKGNNKSVKAWIKHFPEDHGPEADGYYAITFGSAKGQRFNHKKIQSHFLLTKRETEVIDGIFRGQKNIEIAEELYIGETTVKKHIQNICAKMGLRNRTAIIYNILKTLDIA